MGSVSVTSFELKNRNLIVSKFNSKHGFIDPPGGKAPWIPEETENRIKLLALLEDYWDSTVPGVLVHFIFSVLVGIHRQ